MIYKELLPFIKLSITFSIVFFLVGCDFILGIVQPELKEERQIVGELYSYNSKVEEIQKMLKELGYRPGVIDGKIGFRTRDAIKKFQSDQSLKITGYIDKKTWEEINRLYKERFAPLDNVKIGKDVEQVKKIDIVNKEKLIKEQVVEKKGESFKKISVLQIQTALKNAGFSPGPIDGKLGAKTKKAIIEFQKREGLVPDGKVGPKTWERLSKYLKNKD
ncbi:MAG: peptidoglycan-binding protein [Candidatus Omnitrophica bacterium]|nr:peptidoglycan-binding protein [Candidatus Omnitrophota bacterium]MCM8827435.1 peptidoglycan-binding protein [Candidatus Omnitrophota bacterium]